MKVKKSHDRSDNNVGLRGHPLFFFQLSSAQLSDNPFKALTRANCTCYKSSYFLSIKNKNSSNNDS